MIIYHPSRGLETSRGNRMSHAIRKFNRVSFQSHMTLWVHQMEKFSALLAICAGNSPVTGDFPAQRPVTRSFGVSFDLDLHNRLSIQSRGWWFETPSRPLRRHCYGYDQFGKWWIILISDYEYFSSGMLHFEMSNADIDKVSTVKCKLYRGWS